MTTEQQSFATVKYFVIGITRVFGVALMAVGFAILLNNFMQLPVLAGYFLIFMGGFGFIFMPIILSRMWKTPQDKINYDDNGADVQK